MALVEGGEEVIKGGDAVAGCPFQALEPDVVRFRPVDSHRLVGPEGRIHAGLQPHLLNSLVIRERGGRIVRRAHDRNVIAGKDVMHAQRGQARVRPLPDFVRRRGADQGIDPKIALQLEVRPMVQGIAQGPWDGRAPGVELLPGRGVPRAQPLGNPVRPHGPPLVVIAPEPDLREVGEAVVFSDQPRREVAVVIKDGLLLCVPVVKLPRGRAVEQEIVVDEGLHGRSGMSLSMAARPW